MRFSTTTTVNSLRINRRVSPIITLSMASNHLVTICRLQRIKLHNYIRLFHDNLIVLIL
jgi:hypothetical protein